MANIPYGTYHIVNSIAENSWADGNLQFNENGAIFICPGSPAAKIVGTPSMDQSNVTFRVKGLVRTSDSKTFSVAYNGGVYINFPGGGKIGGPTATASSWGFRPDADEPFDNWEGDPGPGQSEQDTLAMLSSVANA